MKEEREKRKVPSDEPKKKKQKKQKKLSIKRQSMQTHKNVKNKERGRQKFAK